MFLILMLVAGQVLAKFGAVESSLEFEEKTLQKLENLRKLLGESRQVAEMRVLSQILVQSKVFSELIENKNLKEFLNDAEASGKFRLYLHQYICNSPFLLGNENMIDLVNAFVTYWLDLGYITVRLHVAEHKKSYLEDIECFFEDEIATRNLKFVNDDFILKFKRDIDFRFNIEDGIKNRVEVVYWNKYNSDDERHFYEKLFEMIDRGLFDNDIKEFLAWKTDTTTKMRTLNLHISHMKQEIIDCEEDKY
ncbi:uncharacterized protein LOC111064509 isoform X6 [Nilaparvata lugens]|uniref:uncharacterized protein LOC111064509 isoform X6 n=1 Tax=Nilaparvata lugens TaxID=108931 RepID=UPI00193E60FE|nr:uncharacterized protein LOC111064509 isoform X6 [Nilaparvata lugens]